MVFRVLATQKSTSLTRAMTPPYMHSSKIRVFSGQSFGFQDCSSTDPSAFRAKHKHFASALLRFLNCYAFHSIACIGTFPELKRCQRPSSHPNLTEVLISKILTNIYCFSPPRSGISTLIHHSAADCWVWHLLLAEGARKFCSFLPADCTARNILPNAPVVGMGGYTTVWHLCTSNLYQLSSGSNWKTDF